jgi:hypothetical protein
VLEAALAGISADRLAVYEVPFDLAPETAARQREYIAKLEDLLARGSATRRSSCSCGSRVPPRR